MRKRGKCRENRQAAKCEDRELLEGKRRSCMGGESLKGEAREVAAKEKRVTCREEERTWHGIGEGTLWHHKEDHKGEERHFETPIVHGCRS